MVKKIFKLKGMHCNSCAQLIENNLEDKVHDVSANYSKGEVEIDFDPEKISEKEIKDILKNLGYECCGEKSKERQKSKKLLDYLPLVIIGVSLLLLIYIILSKFGFSFHLPEVDFNSIDSSASLLLLFGAGLLTGFHCIAMCGGFIVSYTTKNALQGEKSFKQHLVYGGSKVISYAIIGGLFGLIGGIIAFNVKLRGVIAIFAGLFMIFYAFSMFGFKFFRKFQFNPKFLTKIASKKHSGIYKGPFLTGVLSGLFLACGPLQAMYLYAAGTGSFVTGMTSLAVFGLGTLPVMLGFGGLTTVISHGATRKILKIAAVLVLILGVVMLNRGLIVMGSPVSYDSIKESVVGVDSSAATIEGEYQVINMEVNRYGWEPNSFVIKKGMPVKWNIDVKELTGCNNEIIVNDYGLDIKLKKGMNVIEFTPDKEGTVRWSCWMGMIPGSFVVTETGSASQEQLDDATPQTSGSCGGSCGSSTCGATTGGTCGCGG